jgi:hypothetical protein
MLLLFLQERLAPTPANILVMFLSQSDLLYYLNIQQQVLKHLGAKMPLVDSTFNVCAGADGTAAGELGGSSPMAAAPGAGGGDGCWPEA